MAATLSLGQDTAEVLGFETFEVPNLRLGSQELAVSGQQSILSGAEVQGKNCVGFGELLVVLICFNISRSSHNLDSGADDFPKWSCSSFRLRIDYKRSAKLEREEKARKEGESMDMP